MDPKPWYRSPVAYIAGAVILVGFVGSLAGSSSAPQTSNTAAAANVAQTVQTQQPVQTTQTTQTTPAPSPQVQAAPAQTQSKTQSDPSLSNSNTYTNVDGNTVHSPAYTSDGSVPSGATAQCRDGTYSFSQHRSGTCSGHGGVLKWLNN